MRGGRADADSWGLKEVPGANKREDVLKLLKPEQLDVAAYHARAQQALERTRAAAGNANLDHVRRVVSCRVRHGVDAARATGAGRRAKVDSRAPGAV